MSEAARSRPMPALFVGHGSPMNAIEENAFHRAWQALGRALPRPRAILCVSAHWETRGVYVTATEAPETIHDFYGFPKALFDVRYAAPGDPALARRVAEMVKLERVRLDPGRGLDHGAWSVLCALFPEADVPVVQLGLDSERPARFHYELGRELAPLRDEGVLLLGSGNIVHNLRLFDPDERTPRDWAVRFDTAVKERIAARDHATLLELSALGSDARLSVPTPEHYLPLLYALALQREDEEVRFFNDVVRSAISMTSLVIGELSDPQAGPP